MRLLGVEVVVDDCLLPNIVKMQSSIDEVVFITSTGKEVIDVELTTPREGDTR